MQTMITITAKSFDRVVKVLAVVASVFIFILMFLVSADVIGRYLFNRPVKGSLEISESLMAYLVFIAFAKALASGRHIKVEILTSHLSPRWQAILHVVACAGGAFLFALITWQGWNWAWNSWQIREFMEGQLKVPFYPAKFAIPFGGFVFTLQFLVEIVRGLAQMVRPG